MRPMAEARKGLPRRSQTHAATTPKPPAPIRGTVARGALAFQQHQVCCLASPLHEVGKGLFLMELHSNGQEECFARPQFRVFCALVDLVKKKENEKGLRGVGRLVGRLGGGGWTRRNGRGALPRVGFVLWVRKGGGSPLPVTSAPSVPSAAFRASPKVEPRPEENGRREAGGLAPSAARSSSRRLARSPGS